MNDSFIRQSNKKSIYVQNIVTVLYLENSQDFVFEGESHDFWEFAYVDKGSMVFIADGKEFLLRSGEMVFHKPYEFHRLEARKLSSPNISVVSFSCDSPAMKYFENRIFKLTAEERSLFANLLKEGLSAFTPLSDKPPVYGMRQIADAPFGAKQLTFALLEQFLIMLLRRSDQSINRKSRSLSPMSDENYPREIRDIIAYMDANIGKKLSVSDIAAEFAMSSGSLKKLFSTRARCGVIDCFNSRKLQKAKELIRDEHMSMTEIAKTLGFTSLHYFSKLFKLKNGQAPSEYRRSVNRRA